jgi:hypothetical protein
MDVRQWIALKRLQKATNSGMSEALCYRNVIA